MSIQTFIFQRIGHEYRKLFPHYLDLERDRTTNVRHT